ncbi:hypothetical protein GCM10022243_53110 [Saccharothrix violaceirubra]|uniref:Uncharacterized protein n=1 Tax=Saccharothrix violaceirubra TaxID=413306 RepID=A0A7W7SYM9_9PSEU|nr:hypothetical protein [Saccharothrix violaceirubra]MBB4963373.1 hypothetical protein [Saccharothrix violaceirubra]
MADRLSTAEQVFAAGTGGPAGAVIVRTPGCTRPCSAEFDRYAPPTSIHRAVECVADTVTSWDPRADDPGKACVHPLRRRGTVVLSVPGGAQRARTCRRSVGHREVARR